jgi:hypothetical protein
MRILAGHLLYYSKGLPESGRWRWERRSLHDIRCEHSSAP